MIEQVTIDGRKATVAYLKGEMQPATADEHDFIKVLFEDGEVVFAVSDDEVEKFNQRHEPAGTRAGGRFAFGTIYTDDVEVAAKALAQNKKVVLSQPKTVSVLIERLGNITKQMVETGQTPPNFNLCNVYLKGSNLFCVDTKGIPRPKMPQFTGARQRNAFLQYLKDKGYRTAKGKERSDYLRATQDELSGAKVARKAQQLRDSNIRLPRTIVSSDNYILDGHHRWAAQVANDTIDGKLGGSTTRVRRVDIPITQLLSEAKLYGAATEAVNKRGLDPESVEYAEAILDELMKFNPFHVEHGEQGGEFTSASGSELGKPPPNAAGRMAADVDTDTADKIKRKLGDKAGSDLLRFYDQARLLVRSKTSLYARKMGAIKEFISHYPDYKGRTESLFNLLPDYPTAPGAAAFKRDVEKFNPHHVEHGEHGGEFTSAGEYSSLTGTEVDNFLDKYGLHTKDMTRIESWLGSGYRELRTDPNFEKTLNKLPLYTGRVYRGTRMTDEELARLKTGSIYPIDKFSSASPMRSVAHEYMQDAQRYAGDKKTIVMFEVDDSGRKLPRDMAGFYGSDAQEVVLMRGDRYRVNSVAPAEDDEGRSYVRVRMSQVK